MMIWNDNSGEKFFKNPHIDFFKGNKLPALFQQVKNSGDDRSRTILVNLILEHLTDILLGHLIKNYDEFTKETKPSFYLKLSLLKSFDLIPEQILNSIDCLRDLRNRFAHKLDVTNFSDLDDKMVKRINDAFVISSFGSKYINETIENKISRLEFHAVVGLDVYEPNLRLLSEQINSVDFKNRLETEYNKRLSEQSKLLDEYVKSKGENQ